MAKSATSGQVASFSAGKWLKIDCPAGEIDVCKADYNPDLAPIGRESLIHVRAIRRRRQAANRPHLLIGPPGQVRCGRQMSVYAPPQLAKVEPMYGYTPPAVIAIDPDYLINCGGFQRIAWAIHEQLRRRPVWIVVQSSTMLDDAEPEDRVALLESYLMEPSRTPIPNTSPDEGVAIVLQSHLRHMGVELPILLAPTHAQPHAVKSALVPGPWKVAASMARILGASRVAAWTPPSEAMPRHIDGIPFDASAPGGPKLDGLPIDG